MTKKAKVVKEVKEVLTLDIINIGDTIKDLHDDDVEITKGLKALMKQYEAETEKSVIYRGKITGTFLFWNMPKNNKKSKKPKKAEEEIEEIEEEIEVEYGDEEEIDELEEIKEAVDEVSKLDEAIETEAEEEIDESELIDEAYKEKYWKKPDSDQKVNRNAKKYKAFAKKYRESE